VKIKSIISMMMVIALTGCASGYSITYNTEPKGASIICNGINEGYSPVRLNYSPDENNKRMGTMNTVPCTAVWSSGFRKNFSDTWDLNEFPNGVMQTLQRPNGEGYSQDANFALQIQNMQYQRRQAEAAEEAAAAANRRNNKTTTCYTNFGITTCY